MTRALCLLVNLAALAGAVAGVYENPEYGYSVRVPAGLQARGDPAPNPQHGIRITLSPDAFVWVDASYNTTEARSAHALLDDMVATLRATQQVEALTRTKGRLDRLPAESLVIRYRTQPGAPVQVREATVALRAARPPGIVYTIGLIAPAETYEQQRTRLRAVVESFRLRDLSH